MQNGISSCPVHDVILFVVHSDSFGDDVMFNKHLLCQNIESPAHAPYEPELVIWQIFDSYVVAMVRYARNCVGTHTDMPTCTAV